MSKDTLKNDKKTSEPWKFKKGNPGGPGRPKGSNHLKCLEEAMAAKGKKNKRTLWEHAVDRAYMNDSVLIAIIKKFIPDKTHTELTGNAGEPIYINLIPVKNKEDLEKLKDND